MNSHNPQVVTPNLFQQKSGLLAALVVRQAPPFPGNALYIFLTITITMDASMEGWGGHCIVPGSGTALFSDLWTADKHQLHINVLEIRAVRLTPASGAGSPWPNYLHRVRQYGQGVIYIQARGSRLQGPQRRDIHAVPVVDPDIKHSQGDTRARCQQ